MSLLTSQRRLPLALAVLGLVVGIAGLRLARDLLVPLSLAGVACLFLAPFVHFLQGRLRLPRVVAVLFTVAIAASDPKPASPIPRAAAAIPSTPATKAANTAGSSGLP